MVGYIPPEAFQPICRGLDNGELVWEKQYKEPWHQRMFPVHYKGDFSEQWIWLCACQKGMDWQ